MTKPLFSVNEMDNNRKTGANELNISNNVQLNKWFREEEKKWAFFVRITIIGAEQHSRMNINVQDTQKMKLILFIAVFKNHSVATKWYFMREIKIVFFSMLRQSSQHSALGTFLIFHASNSVRQQNLYFCEQQSFGISVTNIIYLNNVCLKQMREKSLCPARISNSMFRIQNSCQNT